MKVSLKYINELLGTRWEYVWMKHMENIYVEHLNNVLQTQDNHQ